MNEGSQNSEAIAARSGIEILLDEQVRSAPEPLRSYIRELKSQTDVANIVRELVYSREEKKALVMLISELKETLRQYRDTYRGEQE